MEVSQVYYSAIIECEMADNALGQDVTTQYKYFIMSPVIVTRICTLEIPQ